MEIIEIEDLDNLTFNERMRGSTADFYTCSFNGKEYVYKEFDDKSDMNINLYKEISTLEEDFLTVPAYLVNDTSLSGYLTSYLSNYELLWNARNNITKEGIIGILKKVKQKIIDMHNIGIVHCDLNPGNIMYKDSDIKIIDFDICLFKSFKPSWFSTYASKYFKYNPLDYSVDIFIFNITTLSILYKIFYSDVLNYDFIADKNFTDEMQKRTWQKTKKLEKLTYDDFLINYY